MADNELNVYSLQAKPWKVWMSSSPDPTAVLVSAADLIENTGSNLEHDIIIYNGNVYSNGIFNSDFNNFYKYCIDIEPAAFDRRYKSATIDLDTTALKDIGLSVDNVKMYCHTKTGALYPEDIKTQYSVTTQWRQFFHPKSNVSEYSMTSYQIADLMTLGVKGSENTEDIILLEKDTVFSNTMTFEDGKAAYTKLRLRVDLDADSDCSEKSLMLLTGAIIFNSTRSDLLLSLYTNAASASNVVSTLRKFLKANFNALSYLYFYVKAPFAGDYIKPTDFNQSLNQDSEVSFRNLLLANDYDKVRNTFNRFNESFISDTGAPSSSAFLEKMTRPYVPKNSPLKDLLSNDLITSSNVIGSTLETKARNLIEHSYDNVDNLFGSALVAPVADDEQTRFTPFTFYDPQSREDSSYYVRLTRIPTVIGKDGNITTDGRIMSPTIDELWYIIKKLISGRSSETDTRISTLKGDYYKGDTSLKEVIDAQYSFDGVIADPIDFRYRTDDNGDIIGYEPSEWVAQPSQTKLIIFNALKEQVKNVNAFYKSQNDEATDRDLDNDSGLSEKSFINQEFGPRANPMSLRELEAAMLGNKYNIVVSFMQSARTFAVTGKFGKEDNTVNAAGSLYQLHKDYNANLNSPNTVFNDNGDESSDAVFSDLGGANETYNSSPVRMLDSKHKRTDDTNGKKMPVMAANYSKSLTDKDYMSSEVFLAADGTWRYLYEHVRMPVLRSRY